MNQCIENNLLHNWRIIVRYFAPTRFKKDTSNIIVLLIAMLFENYVPLFNTY